MLNQRARKPNNRAFPGALQWHAPPPYISIPQGETESPLVSCIMPTANRRQYVPHAIAAFLQQDYAPRELIIVDDGEDAIDDLIPADDRIVYVSIPRGLSLGSKRNHACRMARGTLIVHWDDDDWHAPWRLSYQVTELLAQRVDICGLDRLWFFDPQHGCGWQYCYSQSHPGWLAGGSLCYKRSVWKHRPFPDVTAGEDTRFIRTAGHARLALQRADFYIARIHAHNTSTQPKAEQRWRRVEGPALCALADAVATAETYPLSRPG